MSKSGGYRSFGFTGAKGKSRDKGEQPVCTRLRTVEGQSGGRPWASPPSQLWKKLPRWSSPARIPPPSRASSPTAPLSRTSVTLSRAARLVFTHAQAIGATRPFISLLFLFTSQARVDCDDAKPGLIKSSAAASLTLRPSVPAQH